MSERDTKRHRETQRDTERHRRESRKEEAQETMKTAHLPFITD